MDKQGKVNAIPEMKKPVWCQRCFGTGKISHTYGIRQCDDCSGRGQIFVLYWKPKKNWIKKPLEI